MAKALKEVLAKCIQFSTNIPSAKFTFSGPSKVA
jgi:hypothetical protein